MVKQIHSIRPKRLHRENAWQCKCGQFNVYTNLVCWNSVPQFEEADFKKAKELTAEQKEFISAFKPQSERLTSPGLGDIEEFFSFLSDD